MTNMVPKKGVPPDAAQAISDAIIEAQGILYTALQRAITTLDRAKMALYEPEISESPAPPSDNPS